MSDDDVRDAAPPRVLLIDDEPQIHRFLKPALQIAGYAVETALSGRDGLRHAVSHAPRLVLLDLGLPDLDGQEVLRRLRAVVPVPVIVLSAREAVEEKVRALDGGADDYVEKPFDLGELLARIRVALRHGGTAPARDEPRQLVGGGVRLDLLTREVTVDGVPATMTPREFKLLALLLRNQDRVVTHRQILTGVWGPAHAEDVQYLRVYVGRLRQKLGAASATLRTEPGIGYRFMASLPD